MGLTFSELVKLLGQQEKWTGFDALVFEPKLLSVAETLGCLIAWSKGTKTVRNFVKDKRPDGLPDAERIKGYAADF